MKIGAVSGDLMVKIGLGAVVLVAVYVAYKKASAAAGSAIRAVGDGINPISPTNIAYQTVTTWGGSLNPSPDAPGRNADGSWSLGGWLYDKIGRAHV